MQQSDRKHVFAINSHSEFLNLVRELFEEESYNITTTNFVPNTFDQVAAAQPDVLIIDIAPRGEDSWNLVERLHAEAATRGIPVLIVSTAPGHIQHARDQVARYGGKAYLNKPMNLTDLLWIVAELIGPA